MNGAAKTFDRVFIGDIVVGDDILRGGYVASRGEKIAAIGAGSHPPADEVCDFSGKLILPGLVDGHTHTSSLGWDGIEGTTRGAAAGGVTTCVDMPYDVPNSITSVALLEEKIGWVERTAHVDMALYGTIAKSGFLDAIADLAAAGISAFKVSTYEYDPVRFPRIDRPTMMAAFALMAKAGVPVSVHNEDQELVDSMIDRARAEGCTDPLSHCRTRPPLVEILADIEIYEIGLATGAHVHIAHSSLARAFDIAGQYRALGGKASGEVCVHYLCMVEDDMVRLGGYGKCNPPFRSAAEVERLWQALLEDRVGYVSTDHAPWPRHLKQGPDIFSLKAGLTGLQSFAPLMYSLLVERGLSPTLMAKYCAEKPARFHGLYPRKGALLPGSDCDLVVIESGEFEFDENAMVDRPEICWSPYHGRRMHGAVAATVLRGSTIWDGARILSKPGAGRFVKRQAQ